MFAERLLRGEAEEDGREGASGGECAGVEPRDPRSDDEGDHHRHQPDREPERPSDPRIEAAHQRGGGPTAELAGER
jgi:hypothetical protein